MESLDPSETLRTKDREPQPALRCLHWEHWAGLQAGLSQDQAVRVPGQAEPCPPSGWRRRKHGAQSACPVGGVEGLWGAGIWSPCLC